MLAFLLQRPIAVGMVLTALLSLSVLAFFKLPVSLLPDADVPYLTISVHYPNSPPEEVENNILKPMREQLLSTGNLKSVESEASSETGRITLHFEYGTNMQLAYMEVNEKIDRLTSRLPRNLERPLVVKSSTSDIAVVRIQVIPPDEESLVQVSDLAMFSLKRRLEQLVGVGLVDLNGLRKTHVVITPDYARMASLGLSDTDIIHAVRQANHQIGALTVRDGNYRYFLKLASTVNQPDELGNLPIDLPDGHGFVRLSQVAQVQQKPVTPQGYHFFNGKPGLVLTVHKQPQANMTDVLEQVYLTVAQFKTDFPNLHFEITRDQSVLLNLSIQNLSQALMWGGAFAFAVLFLFMGNWREPLMMGIVLPVSLLLSFTLLYLFNVSLNIISLSGLALGLGMLVDNSIVVVDNISLRRRQGIALEQACIEGTQEVMLPLISSGLTNLAVFVPLIFMSGLTGTLFYNQAIAVVAILSVSLGCTFIIIPLLYLLLYRHYNKPAQEDSRLFVWMKKQYHRSFHWVWQHKTVSLAVMGLFIPMAVILFGHLPKSGFPDIERTETLIRLDWNEAIDVSESARRIQALLQNYAGQLVHAEAEVGQQQFILGTETPTAQQVTLYLRYADQPTKIQLDQSIRKHLAHTYPLLHAEFIHAPNAFEQLFASRQPYYEIRFRQLQSRQLIPDSIAESLTQKSFNQWSSQKGKGFITETTALVRIDFEKLKSYRVSYEELLKALNLAFGEYPVTELKDFGRIIPVAMSLPHDEGTYRINGLTVKSETGNRYPLSQFVSLDYQNQYKTITADANGIYQSVELPEVADEPAVQEFFQNLAHQFGLSADFSGQWFEERENLRQLIFILVVSVVLVYFILTAEFESFSQPLLVMFSLPLGLAGSLILLWLSGGSINIMSGIGLVVVLGILDNDAILKIDRINRLRQHLPLKQAIEQAGLDRLKPIVMNTCTNVLAVTPIIFSAGLGADLQKPVAITTIGGLIAATFTALYFVPLMYAWLYGKKTSL